jgi:Domain of unknown function (DUF4112)
MGNTNFFVELQNMESIKQMEISRTGLSREESKKIEIEENLETLSRYMDGLFTIPGIGWKFGLYSIVGLIPWAGDTTTAIVSFYVLAAGVRYGVPKITLARMGLNIAIGYVIGVIPILGDAFDFVWKPNQMNMNLLRTRAVVSADEAKQGKTSDWLFVAVIMLIIVGLLVGSIALSLLMFGTVFYELWKLRGQ